MGDIIIRPFRRSDRESVRRISRETAFLGEGRRDIFADDEILADALTMYFTDYEPESCFVASSGQDVVGYVIGSRAIKEMRKIITRKVYAHIFLKAVMKGVFLRKDSWRLMARIAGSYLRREFISPDFSEKYPSASHINIDAKYRGMDIGTKLLDHYLNYLKAGGIGGVQVSTMTEGAKDFFIKTGFIELFKAKRSYLEFYFGKDIFAYILGKET